MDPVVARRIVEEATLRFAPKTALIPHEQIDFDLFLFPLQRTILHDTKKYIALLAGRRAGKTATCAYKLVKTAIENPGSKLVYLSGSLVQAKSIIWDQLLDILTRHNIHYSCRTNEGILTLDDYGSVIQLGGATTEADINKLRGKGYVCVVVDEVQCLPNATLENLLSKVIYPTLRDHKNSQLILAGTPGIVAVGMWYRISTGKLKHWSIYKWNMTENPMLGSWKGEENWRDKAKEALEEEKQLNGYTDDHPIYITEWLGEWCVESSANVLNYHPDRNSYTQLPDDDLYYVMGLDFGIKASSAIVVCAFSYTSPNFYVVDCFVQPNLSPLEFGEVIFEWYNRYLPLALIADSNGIGAGFVKQLKERHNLPIQNAIKKDKVGHFIYLDADLKGGIVKINERLEQLISDISTFYWRDPILKVLPTIEPDTTDALLYAYTNSRHFLGFSPRPIPQKTAEELINEEWEQDLEELRKKQELEWWEDI